MTEIPDAGNLLKQCPICGCEQFLSGRLELLHCIECAVILSPCIWQAQVNELLEDEWFGENYRPERSFWVRWFEAWNNRRTIARLLKLPLSGQNLLEIGIGSGSFLRVAQESGFEVMGCDLSKAIATRVNRSFGIRVHCGPLSELSNDRQFDVIVMNHVLEHVPEPVDFLRDVFRLLSLDGVVHIAVPNVSCLEARLTGWTSYEPYHLLYFSPDTLRRTVLRAGFTVCSESTHESFSGWFLALLRTVLRVNSGRRVINVGTNEEDGNTIRDRPSLAEHAYRLAMVIAGIGTWPLRWLQSRLNLGDEAISIGRKQTGEI